MTDAHVRARAHSRHKGCVSPLLGSTQPQTSTWGGLLCERAHTRGKSEFLGRLIREMEARKGRRPAAVGGGGICRRRTNKGQLNQPTDLSLSLSPSLSLPLFRLQPNCYSLTMRMNSRRGNCGRTNGVWTAEDAHAEARTTPPIWREATSVPQPAVTQLRASFSLAGVVIMYWANVCKLLGICETKEGVSVCVGLTAQSRHRIRWEKFTAPTTSAEINGQP